MTFWNLCGSRVSDHVSDVEGVGDTCRPLAQLVLQGSVAGEPHNSDTGASNSPGREGGNERGRRERRGNRMIDGELTGKGANCSLKEKSSENWPNTSSVK